MSHNKKKKKKIIYANNNIRENWTKPGPKVFLFFSKAVYYF